MLNGGCKMKRYICFFVFVYLTILCGCGNSSYNFDGEWYSGETADLYMFTEGNIFCEQHYFTMENGEKTSGGYTAYDDYVDIFVTSLGEYSREIKPMYLIETEGTEALCSTADGTGEIYFYRDREVAERTAAAWQAEWDEQIAELNEESQQKQREIEDSKRNPILTSYDKVLEGKYTNYTVALDGIVSSYVHEEYSSGVDTYEFDLWFWSDIEGEYIQDTYWYYNEEDHPSDIMEIVKSLDDGYKVRITTEIYDDDSFGVYSTTKIEVLERGELSDYGIAIPSDEEEIGEEENEGGERYVYISSSGSKYHAETCRTLKQSSNRILYTDAVNMGYTPCGICNPMP